MMNYLGFNFTIFFFSMASLFTLDLFLLKYSISLKGRFSLRCCFQSFASKKSETKLDWETVSENG